MTCQTCGRTEADGGGHWLGCEVVEPPWTGKPMVESLQTVGQCEFEGCESPKYSDSPRTKYCAEHKDPKNRKE